MKRWIVIGCLLGAVASPSAVAAESVAYTVKVGDSLSAIARHHDTTVAAIRSGNGLKSDAIRIGQRLMLPTSRALAAPVRPKRHLVKQGETLWRIGRQHGVSAEDLMRANGLGSPQALRAGTWLVLTAIGSPAPPAEAGAQVAAVAKVKRAPSPAKGPQTITSKTKTGRAERGPEGVDGAGRAVSFRTIRLSKNETLASLAKRHGMSVEQCNIINGWDYQAETWLAAGSEAHVLNPQAH